MCLYLVLWNTPAYSVHGPELDLSAGIALLRRRTKPAYRLGIILQQITHAPEVHVPEPELSLGVALLSSPTPPGHRHTVVPQHTSACGIHEPKSGLSAYMALCCAAR